MSFVLHNSWKKGGLKEINQFTIYYESLSIADKMVGLGIARLPCAVPSPCGIADPWEQGGALFSKFSLEGPPSSHCGISFKHFLLSHRPCNFSLKEEGLGLQGKEVERGRRSHSRCCWLLPLAFPSFSKPRIISGWIVDSVLLPQSTPS